MKIAVSVILVYLSVLVAPAYANSYLQMITTPPEGVEVDANSADVDYFSDIEKHDTVKNNLWYDYRLVTSAPVVVSSYPKYKAWLETRKYQNQYEFDMKETLQTALYIAEGVLLAFGVYTLYKK